MGKQEIPTWVEWLFGIVIIFGFCYAIFVMIPDLKESSEKQYEAKLWEEFKVVAEHCYIGCLNYIQLGEEDNATRLHECDKLCVNYSDYYTYQLIKVRQIKS